MLSHRNRSAKIAAMYDAVMRLSSENVIVRVFFSHVEDKPEEYVEFGSY